MPVFLEHVTNPSPQDWIDLNKIYTEVPEQNPSPDQTVESTVRHWLSSTDNCDEQWLIAGRFNARLLGAMFARRVGNDVYLANLAVRPVTQGRGVAHQLAHHIQKWARESGYTLIIEEVPETLTDAFEKRGFSANTNQHKFN